MAWPLDHHLDIEFPSPHRQFGQGIQLRELGGVVRVCGGTWPQAIA